MHSLTTPGGAMRAVDGARASAPMMAMCYASLLQTLCSRTSGAACTSTSLATRSVTHQLVNINHFHHRSPDFTCNLLRAVPLISGSDHLQEVNSALHAIPAVSRHSSGGDREVAVPPRGARDEGGFDAIDEAAE